MFRLKNFWTLAIGLLGVLLVSVLLLARCSTSTPPSSPPPSTTYDPGLRIAINADNTWLGGDSQTFTSASTKVTIIGTKRYDDSKSPCPQEVVTLTPKKAKGAKTEPIKLTEHGETCSFGEGTSTMTLTPGTYTVKIGSHKLGTLTVKSK